MQNGAICSFAVKVGSAYGRVIARRKLKIKGDEKNGCSREYRQKDEEIIISIVNEMTESMTGAQSTRHWAEDGRDGALVLVIRKRSGIAPWPSAAAADLVN